MALLPVKKTDTNTEKWSDTQGAFIFASISLPQRFAGELSRIHHLHPRHTMKHLSTAHRLSRWFATLTLTFAFIGPVSAAECPESSPENPQMRRKLARDWFALAEKAEATDNNTEAIRSYACSYKMIAHANTAYNLARVAERGGDFDLSLKMYKAYLALKPEADEKNEVTDIIRILEVKIKDAAEAAVATTPADLTPAPAEPPAPVTPPPVTKVPEISESGSGSIFKGANKYHWMVGGATATALVGGIVLNISARSKMKSCRTNADKGSLQTALNQCNSAKPLAYWSYAMFGITAIGAALEGYLIWGNTNHAGNEEASLSLEWLPGGGAVIARGKF